MFKNTLDSDPEPERVAQAPKVGFAALYPPYVLSSFMTFLLFMVKTTLFQQLRDHRVDEQAQRICEEWSADFAARGMEEEAAFWRSVKLAFVSGALPGERLDLAVRQARRRSEITPPEGLDEETLEALNEIKSEAAYLAGAIGALKRG